MSVPLDLRSIAQALGGVVSGRQVLCPGPNHSRNDRSLSVRLSAESPTGFITFSHAGDPFDMCRDYVASRLGISLDAWRTRGGESRPAPTFTVPDGAPADDEARIARAIEIWHEGRDPAGTIVERYLASRGLELPGRASDVIRFHPRCPWGDKTSGRTIFVPAMVAPMRAVIGDRIMAVHRTRLTEDGRKIGRMMLGPARGSAVKLDPEEDVTTSLAIGEGIETCLAARQFGFGPVWACGSTSNIAALPVLGGVDCLTILGEGGEGSARAVSACADRWLEADREVVLVQPLIGSDMNDALRAVA